MLIVIKICVALLNVYHYQKSGVNVKNFNVCMSQNGETNVSQYITLSTSSNMKI